MKYLMICLLLSVLSFCLITCAAGCILIIVHLFVVSISFLSACGTLFPSARIRQAAVVSFIGLAASALAFVTCRSLDPEICFPEAYITRIEGSVIYDSSFTKNGNHMMKIRLRRCITNTGDEAPPQGLLPSLAMRFRSSLQGCMSGSTVLSRTDSSSMMISRSLSVIP